MLGHDEISLPAFLVNFHCATNAHFQKKMTKFYCHVFPKAELALALKTVFFGNFESFWGEDAFAVSGLKPPFSLFHSLKNVLYFEHMHAYYYAYIITIINLFAYSISFSQSVSGRNIDFTLKDHCPTRPLFYFFGIAVRFDWIKIDVWLKLGVLNYLSQPKLSLGLAHVK